MKGSLTFNSDGHIDHIILNDDEHAAQLIFSFENNITKIYVQAHFSEGFTPFSGLKTLTFDAQVLPDGLYIEQGDITHLAGTSSFNGTLKWSKKDWTYAGQFSSQGANLPDLAPWLFSSGRANLHGTLHSTASNPRLLISQAKAVAQGDIHDISLKFDLPETLGVSNTMGQSNFSTGTLKIEFTQDLQNFLMPNLLNGPFNANANISMDAQGNVNGFAKAYMPNRGLSSENVLMGTKTRIVLNTNNKK